MIRAAILLALGLIAAVVIACIVAPLAALLGGVAVLKEALLSWGFR